MHRKLGAFVLLAALALAAPAWAQTGAARWDSVEAMGNTQMGQGHYADAIASFQRAMTSGRRTPAPSAACMCRSATPT